MKIDSRRLFRHQPWACTGFGEFQAKIPETSVSALLFRSGGL